MNTIQPRKQLIFNNTKSSINNLERLQEISNQLNPHFGSSCWNKHSMVTMNVGALSKLLYLNDLYQRIIDVPGVICEFGVQWGTTLTHLINLRSIYEPFNCSRVVYGFDTFEGFTNIHSNDGTLPRENDLTTLENYENILEETLTLIESFPPLSHLKKFELIKGDATHTVDSWLEDNPHVVISMAIFDMDLYTPTKEVIKKIKPRLIKGSLLVFDELNCKHFPGETLAVLEELGLNNLKLRKNQFQPFAAFAVYGE
ncbi:TylF/MycF/NovP-related O-methyltransferase [Thiopseudomonas denitrificans]|uniref:Macrocin-O-methyltransferase TylF n=1 Tax=Thiopseudomonas denitrificans TaxID=1501432 RepID=A0A4R6TVK1_9GAMM|nr:TylF/MycF/NovP-related O-methyltransferase [Thiopseudomonas denitrificans]TDQ36702.1 macrocin-O-methyltransferase TylF [Thiopseudomonas denitrificans]